MTDFPVGVCEVLFSPSRLTKFPLCVLIVVKPLVIIVTYSVNFVLKVSW